MKICWDNLEKIRYSKKTGKFYGKNNYITYEIIEKCEYCGEPFLVSKYTNKQKRFCSISCGKKGENNPNKRIEVVQKSNNTKRKNGIKKGSDIWNWKGGYRKKNIATYDTYADRLYTENCRRYPKDENILQVKCTYCGKWFIPSLSSVRHRLNVIEDIIEVNGEMKLYCSNECKYECPIFYQKKWPKGFKISTSREVQPQLRQLVFERDNYTCQKCGVQKSLHCHHIEGIRWEPLESADIDKCITYCKSCHKEIHKIEGCGTIDMKCI